ncbi:MAG TPA: amidohydrolase family protein [Dehalococcoidia bacterium]|nr:amidohydrolase family protein [Dehalococcoidia bacterium]
MPVIDLHNHMIAPEVVAFLEREGKHFETRIIERDGGRFFLIQETATRPINDKMLRPEVRLQDMAAEGVGVQAVSCVPFIMYPDVAPEHGLAIAQVNNDALAAVGARDPAHFRPLASAPLQAPELAAKELERVAKLGLRGVEIPPKVGEQGLDEPQFEPFWAAAEALDLLVCIHPFEAAPRGALTRYNFGNLVGNLYDTGLAAALLIYGGVLERHPRLRVVLFHAGGAFPSLIGRLDNGYRLGAGRGLKISRPPSSFVNQYWFDTIAYNPPMLGYLAATYGSDKLVLGSDYPLGGGPPHPVDEVRRVGFAPAVEAAVLGGNAARLLQIEAA